MSFIFNFCRLQLSAYLQRSELKPNLLDTLPTEIFLKIIQEHLNSFDRTRLQLTCKAYLLVENSPSILNIFKDRFHLQPVPTLEPTDWFDRTEVDKKSPITKFCHIPGKDWFITGDGGGEWLREKIRIFDFLGKTSFFSVSSEDAFCRPIEDLEVDERKGWLFAGSRHSIQVWNIGKIINEECPPIGSIQKTDLVCGISLEEEIKYLFVKHGSLFVFTWEGSIKHFTYSRSSTESTQDGLVDISEKSPVVLKNKGDSYYVRELHYDPDLNIVILREETGRVKVCDMTSGSQTVLIEKIGAVTPPRVAITLGEESFYKNPADVSSIYEPSKKWLICASGRKEIIIWDAPSKKIIYQRILDDDQYARIVAIHFDSATCKVFASIQTFTGEVFQVKLVIWDIQKEKISSFRALCSKGRKDELSYFISYIDYDPDTHLILTHGYGIVNFWSETGKHLKEIQIKSSDSTFIGSIHKMRWLKKKSLVFIQHCLLNYEQPAHSLFLLNYGNIKSIN